MFHHTISRKGMLLLSNVFFCHISHTLVGRLHMLTVLDVMAMRVLMTKQNDMYASLLFSYYKWAKYFVKRHFY